MIFKRLTEQFKKATRRKNLQTVLMAAFMCVALDGHHAEAQQKEHCPAIINKEQKQALSKTSMMSSTEKLYRELGIDGSCATTAEIQKVLRDSLYTIGDTGRTYERSQSAADRLEDLARISETGRVLYNFAKENDVYFLSMSNLSTGVEAFQLEIAGKPVILTRTDADTLDLVRTLAHEILHSAQNKKGLTSIYNNWTFETCARNTFSTEAAAMTIEFVVAFEAKLAGDSTHWDDLKSSGKLYGDPAYFNLMEQGYQQARTAGCSEREAINTGARAVCRQILNNDEWMEFYLNSAVESYVKRVISGETSTYPGIFAKGFSDDKVRITSDIGGLSGFMHGFDMPAISKLLDQYPKAKWTVEAIEIQRLKNVHGEDSRKVADAVAAATKNQNPYLLLNLYKVLQDRKEYWEKGTRDTEQQTLYDFMDRALKTQKPTRLSNGCMCPEV